MARPIEFDPEEALDAAIGLFREHGFAATSAEMLTDRMSIGKQSLYNTFGGKWELYCAALERYAAMETASHMAALRRGKRALRGVAHMLKRVVDEARQPCLGVGSVNEFGCGREELNKIREAAGGPLRALLASRIRLAQQEGDVPPGLDPNHAAAFVSSNVAAIRIAARGGATDAELRAIARLGLRALSQ